MLKTADAWCYLNLENPVCAWAAYRGILVQAPQQQGFISLWMASMLNANNFNRIEREFALESIRLERYPSLISRLKGMYVFTNKDCAKLAEKEGWGDVFVQENLSELSLAEARTTGIQHDANWITYPDESNWMDRYWLGESHPRHQPIWEVLAEGRLILLGTELREKAFKISQEAFPDSMDLLEVGRLAAWIGSNLGNITPFLKINPPHIALQYFLDMQDANNEDFLCRLKALRESGHSINWEPISHLLSRDVISLPDFRAFGFSRQLSEMPYLK